MNTQAYYGAGLTFAAEKVSFKFEIVDDDKTSSAIRR